MGSAATQFEFASLDKLTKIATDGLVLPVFKSAKKSDSKSKDKAAQEKSSWTLPSELQALDKALGGLIAATAKEEKFDGSSGKQLVIRIRTSDPIKARRIILVGLGTPDKAGPADLEKSIPKALATVTALAEFSNAAILLPSMSKISSTVAVQVVVDGVYQATYKSAESKDKPPALKKITLLSSGNSKELQAALTLGEIMAKARSLCKDLVNKPANLKTTNSLVEVAKSLSKRSGLTVSIQSNVSWIQKNMPCFYAVARGSLASDPPKFIQIHYKPSGKAKKKIAIIGKSVIFDTGGYQVKTGNYMNTMKGDMTGGAVMLATMQAISEIKPAGIEIIAYMAATPNKIDSDAMIPDSIFDTTCGKKVEMRHTDAEGRLTLIDAVAMAVKEKPDEIITMATLTGSASQAVGCTIALLGNNDELISRVEKAAKSLGDPIETLAVTPEDYGNIKSKLDAADIINTSYGKGRGAQTAAAFVMSGAPDDVPMAHMDIAGADMTPDEKATGIGQKTMIQYLLNEASRAGGQANPVKAPKAAATKKPAKKRAK